jgi:uracil-DNA glycosylase
VLLLNATLTVEQGQAGSHQGKGWETFTDSIIDKINDHRQGVVFMLWGSYAQKKAPMIDAERHLVLQSVHPSPLSAYRGFLGCGHFSKANQYLESQGVGSVDWRLPMLKETVQEELDF